MEMVESSRVTGQAREGERVPRSGNAEWVPRGGLHDWYYYRTAYGGWTCTALLCPARRVVCNTPEGDLDQGKETKRTVPNACTLKQRGTIGGVVVERNRNRRRGGSQMATLTHEHQLGWLH